MYSALIESANGKYKKSGGEKGILEISALAQNDMKFETTFKNLMDDYFKSYFDSANAVLPLFDGYKYTPSTSDAAKKYSNEISDINTFYLNYPSKQKNRLGNIYVKHFLKKDFNFNSNKYFPYSHKCIYERKFVPSNKVLFPSKTILEKYDFAHKEINEILKKKEEKIKCRNCEHMMVQFLEIFFYWKIALYLLAI